MSVSKATPLSTPAPEPIGLFRLSPAQKLICVAVCLVCIGFGLYGQATLWHLDPSGISPLGKRLPYWDFTNLWAGSLMVLEGKIGLLFDVEAYRAELDLIFNVALPDQEWSYPPSILLVGLPLALLPIWAAYWLWSIATIAALHFALRPFRLPVLVHVLVLFSPAIWSNQIFGQNGALTAALLIAGLYNAPYRPILAGVLVGLLTIKPHLGILLPFCLLAGCHWRAFASAVATSAALVLLTGLAFGFDVWTHFLTETRALMTWVMEAPYPQAYHTNAATVFILTRSLGASLPIAYAAQVAVALLAIAAAVAIWLPSNRLDHRSRVAFTGVLVIVATPYGYTHDTAPLYLAVAWFLMHDRKPLLVFYAAIWLFALVFPSFHQVGIAGGVLGPIALAAYLWPRFVVPSLVSPEPAAARWPATACAAPLPRPGDPRPS